MQLEPQKFLSLCENANSICFFDIEATGLRGDYNSVLVASIKPYRGKPVTFRVAQAGNDRAVVRQIREELAKYDCWVTFYGKGFDIPMVNTRLLRWRQQPIESRHHVDMYYTLKYNTLTARRSQAHMLRFLDVPEKKMDVGPEEWNAVLANVNGPAMKTMIARCESDVEGLQGLYERTRHVIKDIKR